MTPVDQAYDERNRVVSALARTVSILFADDDPSDPGHIYAWRGKHQGAEAWDPEWTNVVFVELPTGQCSWHVHDRDLPLFEWLPLCPKPWDGHTTAEKYDRIARYSRGEW